MPSIIFCYRILFGLQRKVSLGGGGSTLKRAATAPFHSAGSPFLLLLLAQRPVCSRCPTLRPRQRRRSTPRYAQRLPNLPSHLTPVQTFHSARKGGREGGLRKKAVRIPRKAEKSFLIFRRRYHLKELPCSGLGRTHIFCTLESPPRSTCLRSFSAG